MRKPLHTFLAILLCLATLFAVLLTGSGCNAGNESSGEISSAVSEKENSADESSAEEETNTLAGTAYEGVYVLKQLENNVDQDSLYAHGGSVRFCCWSMEDESYTVTVWRASDGTETGSVTEKNVLFHGWTEEGFYFCKADAVILYDNACKEIKSYPFVCKGFNFDLTPDGKYALYSSETGAVRLYDLENGKDIALTKEIYITGVNYRTDSYFLASAPDGTLYRVSVQGEVVDTQTRLSAHLAGGILVETNRQGYILTTTESPQIKFIYGDVASEYALVADPTYMISALQDDTLRLYDTEKNLSSDPMNLGSAHCSCMDEKGRAFLFCSDADEKQTVYMLDCAAVPCPHLHEHTGEFEYGEDYEEYFDTSYFTDDAVKQAVNAIYDTYGIRVFFRLNDYQEDELLFYKCPAYTGDQMKMLDMLRDYLVLNPKDLYREVLAGEGELWVLFTDDILDFDGSDAHAAAFTAQYAGHAVIAVETKWDDENIRENISHEFIHFMDYGVDAALLYDEWEKLSPAGSYFGSYVYPEKDAERYTFSFELMNNREDDIYFTDIYARTFVDEDHARTGENLYKSYRSGVLNTVFDFPHTYAKAKALVSYLRATYSCLNEIPEGEWYLEKYLTK